MPLRSADLVRARFAYCEDHETLSPEEVADLEQIFEARARYEAGLLGRHEGGFYEDGFSPGDENLLTLLELPSSRLLGWTWSDTYTVRFRIRRQDLTEARFDSVVVSFSH